MLKGIASAAAALAIVMVACSPSFAQVGGSNFVDRKPVIINNAGQYLTLSDFSFENAYRDRSTRFIKNLKWSNSGTKSIIAFEVVMLFYDPFNRPIVGFGGRWLVPGHNSANWSPLAPGQTDSDGLIGFHDEDAFFGVAYVRAIRFDDGTVWTSNQAEKGNGKFGMHSRSCERSANWSRRPNPLLNSRARRYLNEHMSGQALGSYWRK